MLQYCYDSLLKYILLVKNKDVLKTYDRLSALQRYEIALATSRVTVNLEGRTLYIFEVPYTPVRGMKTNMDSSTILVSLENLLKDSKDSVLTERDTNLLSDEEKAKGMKNYLKVIRIRCLK